LPTERGKYFSVNVSVEKELCTLNIKNIKLNNIIFFIIRIYNSDKN